MAYDSVLFSFLTWPPAQQGFQAQGLQRVTDTTEKGGEQAGEEPSLSSPEMATPSPQLGSQAQGPPLAFSYTSSNPLANPFGSAVNSHPPSDISHHLCGSHPSPGQHYHSPGLCPRHPPCGPDVTLPYSPHRSQSGCFRIQF